MHYPLRLICTFFALFLSISAFSSLRATFDYKQYLIPGEGTFLEVHLSFDGTSLNWATQDSLTHKASVESTILVNKGDEIVDFRKTVVSSSEQNMGVYADFIDIQRFLVPEGEYELELQLKDIHSSEAEPYVLKQPIVIDLSEAQPGIASITLVEAYAKTENPTELTKSGMDILPLISDFLPESADRLVFYTELYNADQVFEEEKYLVTYALWNEFGSLEDTRKYLRKNTAGVTPLLEVIDLSNLSSGNYDLVVEMRTRENEEVASASIRFFKAQKPRSIFEADQSDYANQPGLAFSNPDSLREYVHCLYPIAGQIKRNTINNFRRAGADMEVYRSFFDKFWMDMAPDDPIGEWKKYIREVWYVNAEYTTPVLKGYETDRGRVWLQYGKPNTIVKRHNETEVFPYEIWHYYKIGRFNDKRFLFFSRAVVNYDFDLLHSDMPNEVQNQDWPSIIRSKNNDLRPTESQENALNPRDTYSRDEVEDLFYNPR